MLMTKPRGVVFSRLEGGVLIRVVAQYPGEALIEVLAGGTFGFSRVVEAFQKVDLGDSASRRCNQFSPDIAFSGVVSVTDLVSIYLKKFDGWELRGLQLVVHMELGAE